MSVVNVEQCADVDAFSAAAGHLLADPVRATIPIGALHSYRSGSSAQQPLLLVAIEDARPVGLALRTPPWPVTVVFDPAVGDRAAVGHAIGAAIVRAGTVPPVRMLSGPIDEVEAVRAGIFAASDRAVIRTVELLLHRLGTFRPPPTSGAAVTVGPADPDDPAELALLARWRLDFARATGMSTPGQEPEPAAVRRSVRAGAIWVCARNEAGTPLALAVAGPVLAGVSRIGPVYTPPDFERRGLGSAATAGAVLAARAAGARTVILFTDRANPTANSIYRTLGFEPFEAYREITFAP